ncbi:hypothetical protein DLAC_11313 [Tieghemostelium lacteum]|uniref:Uncharacterized protein n=1 Tax=Tieghemostelium lacteum TaxID=361077 RepID=A0A151Z3P9_TIELA|nr:hypothetical protein DLAC_11313 [Tieghemostelium lacteum]|eukprot:KYQ88579.1 hypothetical protein DLAC_11313 [Tieghemostelium lacteum]
MLYYVDYCGFLVHLFFDSDERIFDILIKHRNVYIGKPTLLYDIIQDKRFDSFIKNIDEIKLKERLNVLFDVLFNYRFILMKKFEPNNINDHQKNFLKQFWDIFDTKRPNNYDYYHILKCITNGIDPYEDNSNSDENQQTEEIEEKNDEEINVEKNNDDENIALNNNEYDSDKEIQINNENQIMKLQDILILKIFGYLLDKANEYNEILHKFNSFEKVENYNNFAGAMFDLECVSLVSKRYHMLFKKLINNNPVWNTSELTLSSKLFEHSLYSFTYQHTKFIPNCHFKNIFNRIYELVIKTDESDLEQQWTYRNYFIQPHEDYLIFEDEDMQFQYGCSIGQYGYFIYPPPMPNLRIMTIPNYHGFDDSIYNDLFIYCIQSFNVPTLEIFNIGLCDRGELQTWRYFEGFMLIELFQQLIKYHHSSLKLVKVTLDPEFNMVDEILQLFTKYTNTQILFIFNDKPYGENYETKVEDDGIYIIIDRLKHYSNMKIKLEGYVDE